MYNTMEEFLVEMQKQLDDKVTEINKALKEATGTATDKDNLVFVTVQNKLSSIKTIIFNQQKIESTKISYKDLGELLTKVSNEAFDNLDLFIAKKKDEIKELEVRLYGRMLDFSAKLGISESAIEKIPISKASLN